MNLSEWIFWICSLCYLFLSLRQITWSKSQQKNLRRHVDHLSTSLERISTQLCVPLAHFRSVLSKSLWATWIQRQCRIFIRRLHLSRFVQFKYVLIKFKKGRKGNALYGPFYQYKHTFGQIHGCQRDMYHPLPYILAGIKVKPSPSQRDGLLLAPPPPSGFENFLRSFLMITYTAVIKKDY